MTTVYDISLKVAKEVTDVLEGVATQGATTYLKDTNNLTQRNSYFDRGSLWIKSGTHASKVLPITGHLPNKLTFAALASALCVQQVETATVVGSVTGDGNATVIITAANMPNSPKTLSVAVLNLDNAAAVATKIRAAMNADADVTGVFTVGGTGADISLTSIVALANDTTLSISIDNGSCTGLTAAPTSTNTTAGVAGPRYAVIRSTYPWSVIVSKIQDALDETYVTGEDYSLVGDGTTLEFTLPTGVKDVKYVEIEDTSIPRRSISTHCRERLGKLRFDYGYAPEDDYVIHVFYKKTHDELTAYSTTISDEIDLEWLRYKAAEQLLWWAHNEYKGNPELGIDERMTKVVNALKGRYPRRDGPDFVIHTAGG